MASVSNAFSHLLAPGLRKVFFEYLKDYPEEYPGLANVDTSSRAYEEELTMAGLGAMQRKLEHQPTIYDDPIQGDVKRYTHVSFGLGVRVSRELYDDDLYGPMKKMTKELARAARLTSEIEFAELLNDAFDGNTYTGADGLALCYNNAGTGHTLLTGGNYVNRPQTDVELSITALRAAIENIEGTVDERGLLVLKRPVLLVVSPTYQWVAKELLKSAQTPYTADNQINAFADLDLKYMTYHYFDNPKTWFVMAPKSEEDLKFFWRVKPEFQNGDDFDTGDAKFKGYERFSVGFTDWRGVYGSNPS